MSEAAVRRTGVRVVVVAVARRVCCSTRGENAGRRRWTLLGARPASRCWSPCSRYSPTVEEVEVGAAGVTAMVWPAGLAVAGQQLEGAAVVQAGLMKVPGKERQRRVEVEAEPAAAVLMRAVVAAGPAELELSWPVQAVAGHGKVDVPASMVSGTRAGAARVSCQLEAAGPS